MSLSSKPQPVGESSSAPAANMPGGKPQVINPYAKKKSIQSTETSQDLTTSMKANGAPVNSVIKNNPYLKNKNKRPRQLASSPYKGKLPPPPDVDEFTTFSQAFSGGNDADYFGEEDRAEQLVFEQSLESSSATASESNINKSSNSTALVDNGITARDHQSMLQDNVLHISTRQRGNPIIDHIRNVPFKYSTMVPDYILAPTRCALFLSLRYHNLHPNYIHRRIAELKSDFVYRMLLCHVDIEDNASAILFLNDLCCQHNFTLILAWSEEMAARYLETVKVFNGKDPSTIIGKREIGSNDHLAQTAYALKGVASVNQTDSSQLLTQFGSWKNMTQASIEELSVCPGIGVKKVRRLHEAFHRPFSREFAKRRKERENKEKKKDGDVKS